MVLSMLLALTTCPAMLGTQEAIRQSQSKERREEHRARRCNLIATCVKPSIRSREINGRQVILRDNKLYIDTGTAPEDEENPATNDHFNPTEENERRHGHPFAGYFLQYPDAEFEGLVSTITDVAPILNWIYVDRDTGEVKYGVRADAQPNVTGPFDCTRLDRRLTLDGWEGFVAVEEYPAVWALYFDLDDDGLRGKIPFGTRVLEVELQRREKKVTVDVKREAAKEQEILKMQMEQQRQRQEAAQQQEEAQRQRPEEDADDESPGIETSKDSSAVPQIVAHAEETESYPHVLDHRERKYQDEESGHPGNESPRHINETDLSRLRISTGADSGSLAEQAEGTVGTPADTNCGASIWSAPEETSKSVRNGSVISHATPDSSVQGDDEVAAAEAVFRQNDAIGAPSPLFSQKYRKPYVEDEE
ncbi:hypothetical protein DBV05_g754 [Lasiodiplodia theobromae]|uniref:Uncharacterized protein n=1 Tax=Lasiodiplodia theobromae TaxID=45133 RepID=A0A5N5DSF1_9PEZI|nr:hypothetical protein DBV05_g754 [Lasiodiplodia theobromae]